MSIGSRGVATVIAALAIVAGGVAVGAAAEGGSAATPTAPIVQQVQDGATAPAEETAPAREAAPGRGDCPERAAEPADGSTDGADATGAAL